MRAGVLALCVTIPACGLVSSSDSLVPFPSDGVTGFGDAEPIEVCLGAARVVSPDAPSGAVCVADGAVARACKADGECTGIERCACGRCIVEVCQGGGDCGDGRVCRDKRCTAACTMDAECPKGEVCSTGGCARPCAGDGDCHFGERCDKLGNTCRAKPCSEATPCGAGARCEAASSPAELHEPEVASIGNAKVAWVELRAGASRAIHRATVDGPGRWTISPIEPVLGGPGDDVGAPSALIDGDSVELYFAIGDGAGIGRAVSSDGGITFTRDAAPLLVPGPAWEKGRVGSPAVVRYREATYLFYEGGAREGVGLARVDGGMAVRVSEAPILTPATVSDPGLWHDVTEVGAPYAVVAGDIVRVYFTARGAEGSDALVGDVPAPADANDSIGMLATLDMKAWSVYPTGPVLARLTNLRTYLGEREAAVRLVEGGAEITFVATDASGKVVSGLATAATPPAGNP